MWLETFSYTEKHPAIMTLMASLTNKKYFVSKFFGWYEYLNGNDPYAEEYPEYSPGGLLIYRNWGKYDGVYIGEMGSLKYANNAALLALITAKLRV